MSNDATKTDTYQITDEDRLRGRLQGLNTTRKNLASHQAEIENACGKEVAEVLEKHGCALDVQVNLAVGTDGIVKVLKHVVIRAR